MFVNLKTLQVIIQLMAVFFAFLQIHFSVIYYPCLLFIASIMMEFYIYQNDQIVVICNLVIYSNLYNFI